MRCDILLPNLSGVEMYYGKIDLCLSHRFSCFFITEHEKNPDYIKKQAMPLIMSGCREYTFFGMEKETWHRVFDDVDIELNPDSTPETVAVTVSCESIEDFAFFIYDSISCRSLIPYDNYLIYDDEAIYKEVLHQLKLCEKEYGG